MRRKKKPNNRLTLTVAPLVAGLLIFILWEVLTRWGGVPGFLLPSPIRVLNAIMDNMGLLLRACGDTAISAGLGWILAGIVGMATGGILSSSSLFFRALYPWIILLQLTPVVVLSPLILFWLGSGREGIVCTAFLLSFFPVLANALKGFRSSNPDFEELLNFYGASPWDKIRYLRLPSCLPYLFTGLQIAATLAPIGAITGEFFGGKSPGSSGGIGYLVWTFKGRLMTAELFATAAAACALGGFFFLLVVALRQILARFFGPAAVRSRVL